MKASLHTVTVKGYSYGTKKKETETLEIFCASGEDVASLARQICNNTLDDIYDIIVGTKRSAIISRTAQKEIAKGIVDVY